MSNRNAAAPVGPTKAWTYEEVVHSWKHEREVLGYVAPYTARKSAQKALLFSPYLPKQAADITPQGATLALVSLGTSKRRNGQRLSSATLHAAHLAATQAMGWAQARSIVESNPFKQVPRPKANYRQSQFLTAQQAHELATSASESLRGAMASGNVTIVSFALAVCVALATGMRRGELFALTWGDFSEHRRSIYVNKAIKADGTLGIPKSNAGLRNIALGEGLCSLLTEARAWQANTLRSRGTLRTDAIICNELGERASMNAFGHWWRAWVAEQGHAGLRFHELRHTHATLLIAAGTDVKTVQVRLGHSSAEITMSIYAHALPQADGPAAVALDEKLFA